MTSVSSAGLRRADFFNGMRITSVSHFFRGGGAALGAVVDNSMAPPVPTSMIVVAVVTLAAADAVATVGVPTFGGVDDVFVVLAVSMSNDCSGDVFIVVGSFGVDVVVVVVLALLLLHWLLFVLSLFDLRCNSAISSSLRRNSCFNFAFFTFA